MFIQKCFQAKAFYAFTRQPLNRYKAKHDAKVFSISPKRLELCYDICDAY